MTKTTIDPLTKDDAVPSMQDAVKPLFMWHGSPFYLPFGAEGDDDATDDSDSESDDGEDDTTGASDDKEGERPVTRDEFDKLRKQLSASDKNRAAAEKKLADIENAKKDDLTKATDQVTELTKAREADGKVIAELRMQNAFLTADTGITWHDPADALALAERKGYLTEVVDDDGQVDEAKLATKLKELAKAKPHLVKSGSDQGSGSDGSNGGQAKPTGQKVGSKRQDKKDEPDLSRYGRFLNT